MDRTKRSRRGTCYIPIGVNNYLCTFLGAYLHVFRKIFGQSKKKQYLCNRVQNRSPKFDDMKRTIAKAIYSLKNIREARGFEDRGGMAASQTRRASFFLQAHSDDGMWRSPVAQRSGGPEVASSNLVIPTSIEGNGNNFHFLFLYSVVLPNLFE